MQADILQGKLTSSNKHIYISSCLHVDILSSKDNFIMSTILFRRFGPPQISRLEPRITYR